MRIHWQLYQADLNPELHKSSTKKGLALAAMESARRIETLGFWSEPIPRDNHGLPWDAPYWEEVCMGVYIVGPSAKLKWLAGLTHQICTEKGK